MFIAINNESSEPVYRQIVQAVKQRMAEGELVCGDELPPVRTLADALGVNLHTVRHAYQTLEAEGIAVTRLGRRAKIVFRKNGLTARLRKKLLGAWRELEIEAALNGIDKTELLKLIGENNA